MAIGCLRKNLKKLSAAKVSAKNFLPGNTPAPSAPRSGSSDRLKIEKGACDHCQSNLYKKNRVIARSSVSRAAFSRRVVCFLSAKPPFSIHIDPISTAEVRSRPLRPIRPSVLKIGRPSHCWRSYNTLILLTFSSKMQCSTTHHTTGFQTTPFITMSHLLYFSIVTTSYAPQLRKSRGSLCCYFCCDSMTLV